MLTSQRLELTIFLHSDNMAVCGSERHERVLCQQTQTYITIGWVLYYWLVEQSSTYVVLTKYLYLHSIIKRKQKIPHCRNSSKIQLKIIGRGNIDTPNTQMHDRSLSCLGTLIPLTHKYMSSHFPGLEPRTHKYMTAHFPVLIPLTHKYMTAHFTTLIPLTHKYMTAHFPGLVH
jgi:hypothetical protein